MKAKHQRLTLLLLAVGAMGVAALLIMSALKDQAAFFYTPTDAAGAHIPVGKPARLGGMVAGGSIEREPDGVTIRFLVTDGKETVPVRFTGITPDLFKEDSGVVAEGRFAEGGLFVADNILAKHDERYMPPQVAGAMHKSGSLEE